MVKQSGNNSGIQYRSRELGAVGKWSIGGYQCDIHPKAVNNATVDDERELEGLLAIQAHRGPAMKVEIKGIQLKELPDGELLSMAENPIPKDAKPIGPPAKDGAAPLRFDCDKTCSKVGDRKCRYHLRRSQGI